MFSTKTVNANPVGMSAFSVADQVGLRMYWSVGRGGEDDWATQAAGLASRPTLTSSIDAAETCSDLCGFALPPKLSLLILSKIDSPKTLAELRLIILFRDKT